MAFTSSVKPGCICLTCSHIRLQNERPDGSGYYTDNCCPVDRQTTLSSPTRPSFPIRYGTVYHGQYSLRYDVRFDRWKHGHLQGPPRKTDIERLDVHILYVYSSLVMAQKPKITIYFRVRACVCVYIYINMTYDIWYIYI